VGLRRARDGALGRPAVTSTFGRLLALAEGRFPDAIQLFTRAGDAARAVGDTVSAGTARGNLGLVYTKVGSFVEAREALLTMQRVAHQRGNSRTEANAVNNLAALAIKEGDPAGAVPLLEKARDLFRTAGSPVGEENALGQLGTRPEAMGLQQREQLERPGGGVVHGFHLPPPCGQDVAAMLANLLLSPTTGATR